MEAGDSIHQLIFFKRKKDRISQDFPRIYDSKGEEVTKSHFCEELRAYFLTGADECYRAKELGPDFVFRLRNRKGFNHELFDEFKTEKLVLPAKSFSLISTTERVSLSNKLSAIFELHSPETAAARRRFAKALEKKIVLYLDDIEGASEYLSRPYTLFTTYSNLINPGSDEKEWMEICTLNHPITLRNGMPISIFHPYQLASAAEL
jgi:hypothetical protein